MWVSKHLWDPVENRGRRRAPGDPALCARVLPGGPLPLLSVLPDATPPVKGPTYTECLLRVTWQTGCPLPEGGLHPLPHIRPPAGPLPSAPLLGPAPIPGASQAQVLPFLLCHPLPCGPGSPRASCLGPSPPTAGTSSWFLYVQGFLGFLNFCVLILSSLGKFPFSF